MIPGLYKGKSPEREDSLDRQPQSRKIFKKKRERERERRRST
jgi:hypothetical protein